MGKAWVCVRDAERQRDAIVDELLPDVLIGSLSADPWTLDELRRAMCRFAHPQVAEQVFDGWTDRPVDQCPAADENHEGPACVIDLAARFVAVSWEQRDACGTLATPYLDADGPLESWFSADLHSSWQRVVGLREWASRAGLLRQQQTEKRREEASRPKVREVLFGEPLWEFLADASRQSVARVPGPLDRRLRYDLARQIHERWLLTSREDLGGLTPRAVIVEGIDHLRSDLEQRADQWSAQGFCPPGLTEEDRAYENGYIGRHEGIFYYDLVRHLLDRLLAACVALQNSHEGEPSRHRELVSLARTEQERWLECEVDGLAGYRNVDVIERERRRLPLIVKEEAPMLDHDCPICQMMRDSQTGPGFWWFDEHYFDEGRAFVLSMEFWDSNGEDLEPTTQDMAAEPPPATTL